MTRVENDSVDPFFNLALEETLLTAPRDAADPILILWRNKPTVVIGARQNALEEIDPAFVAERGIEVVRRSTGGGAVYHDLGNLNFTFIRPDVGLDVPLRETFRVMTTPIVDALRALGVDAVLSDRNDVEVGDKKISGTAQIRRAGRVMLHGTLLFDSDLDAVDAALRPDPIKLRSRSVASVRSRVANIVDYLPDDAKSNAMERFIVELVGRLERTDGLKTRRPTEEETRAANRLRDEKYATRAWNIDAAPAFQLRRVLRPTRGKIELALDVERGAIARARFFGDFLAPFDVEPLENALIGVPFERGAMAARLGGMWRAYLPDLALDDALTAIFGV